MTQQVIELHLTPAEQRKVVESEVKGPAFRMWLTAAEHAAVEDAPDYTYHQLSDGRFAAWRPQAELEKLRASSDPLRRGLARYIESRIITDDVT